MTKFSTGGEAVLIYFGHYLFLITLCILSYGIGRRLLQRIQFNGAGEQFSFCATLGLGFLSYLILLIGILGILYRWLVLLLIGGLFMACWPVWTELTRQAFSAWRLKGPKGWKLFISV